LLWEACCANGGGDAKPGIDGEIDREQAVREPATSFQEKRVRDDAGGHHYGETTGVEMHDFAFGPSSEQSQRAENGSGRMNAEAPAPPRLTRP
jgi:hypothetical protein